MLTRLVMYVPRTTVAEKAMSEFVSRSRELQKQRDQAYDKADKVNGRDRIGDAVIHSHSS